MEFLLNRYRNLTVLLVVIAGQLLLLAYQVKSKQDVPLIRVWAVSAVMPMAKLVEVVRRNTVGFVYDYLVLVNIREQNRSLTDENGRLKMENQRLQTDLQTADRVKALVAYQAQSPSKTVHARIIAMGTGFNSQAVYIDRGTKDGVERGMSVVTPDGIVGKILAAYPSASLIMKVTDPNFAAGVISQKTHVRGTAKGVGQPTCVVEHVQNQEPVEQGEMFYTSGDDRIFPKGLPVGVATVVRPGRTNKEIVLEPVGLRGGLEEVLVIVEGVHQNVPDPKSASPAITMLPPPPETAAEKAKAEKTNEAANAFPTDADRLRDRYKKIGEIEKHGYGDNGANVPNFNLDPDKKAAAAPPQPAPAPAGKPTARLTPIAVATAPVQKKVEPPPVAPRPKPPVENAAPVRPEPVRNQVTKKADPPAPAPARLRSPVESAGPVRPDTSRSAAPKKVEQTVPARLRSPVESASPVRQETNGAATPRRVDSSVPPRLRSPVESAVPIRPDGTGGAVPNPNRRPRLAPEGPSTGAAGGR